MEDAPRSPPDYGERMLELRRLSRWRWETYETHGWLSWTGDPFWAFTAEGAVRRYRRRLRKWLRNAAQ